MRATADPRRGDASAVTDPTPAPPPATFRLCSLCASARPARGRCPGCRRLSRRRCKDRLRAPEEWVRNVLRLAQRSAQQKRRRGRPVQCTITADAIRQLFARQGGVCYFTGQPFLFHGGVAHPRYPSLDRQDCDGDYTLGNCRLVTWWVNRSRNTDAPATFVDNLRAALETFATAPCHAELYTAFLPR